MKVRLGRRLIRVRYSSRLTANHGLAYLNNDEMVIDRNLSGKEELETLLHEAEHLAHPDETERNVTRNAKFYANLLWRLGYRKSTTSKPS